MTNRNQESREAQIQAKQAYLREHIAQDRYEDFGEFCESIAGNVDIQAWGIEYVRELVDKFKRKEADKEKNKKKAGQSFHLYQTGSSNQIKSIAEKLKQEKQERQEKLQTNKNEPKSKNFETNKPKEQKTALEVLDSIFENHQSSEYETKRYDKAFFESCNFWEAPVAEDASQKEKDKEKTTPTKAKNSPNNQLNKFASNSFPLQPENFQKMFKTGLNLPQPKTQIKEKSAQQKVFVQIPIDQEPPKKNQSQRTNVNKSISNNEKKNDKPNETKNEVKKEIKLVSVKNIKNPKNPKIPYDGEILVREPFKDTVACFKSFERQALSAKDLKVVINDHEIINRSFFSADYPMFHLKVQPNSITCKRNFEDFQKLKRNLQCVYPGVRLPYLQKLGWLESEINPQYISKQKKYLTYFLEDALQHNELRNSRIMEDFLTLKDHKQMKRKFEQYDKIKKIASIEELCLLEGEVKVEITEVNRQYNEYLQAFITKMKIFWNNEQRILKDINEMHIKLAENYKELRELIEEISQQTKDFNKRVNINEFECLEDAFQNLSFYVTENIKINEKESQFLTNSVLVYLRYEKQNMNMFDSVVGTRANLTRAYLRRKDGEKATDNLEYLSERLKDFKCDILQESKSITILKYQCGYINNLLANEGQRYFTFLSQKMEKMISDICYSKLQYLSKTINTYTSLVYS